MSQPSGQPTALPQKIWFTRPEMNAVLRIYGQMVATGEARDYAIDMLPDRAVFAIYKRSAEAPSWRVEKVPALARRQGAFVIYGANGQVLRRGHDLSIALRVIGSRNLRVID